MIFSRVCNELADPRPESLQTTRLHLLPLPSIVPDSYYFHLFIPHKQCCYCCFNYVQLAFAVTVDKVTKIQYILLGTSQPGEEDCLLQGILISVLIGDCLGLYGSKIEEHLTHKGKAGEGLLKEVKPTLSSRESRLTIVIYMKIKAQDDIPHRRNKCAKAQSMRLHGRVHRAQGLMGKNETQKQLRARSSRTLDSLQSIFFFFFPDGDKELLKNFHQRVAGLCMC